MSAMPNMHMLYATTKIGYGFDRAFRDSVTKVARSFRVRFPPPHLHHEYQQQLWIARAADNTHGHPGSYK
jgi:hypothetical protein